MTYTLLDLMGKITLIIKIKSNNINIKLNWRQGDCMNKIYFDSYLLQLVVG